MKAFKVFWKEKVNGQMTTILLSLDMVDAVKKAERFGDISSIHDEGEVIE